MSKKGGSGAPLPSAPPADAQNEGPPRHPAPPQQVTPNQAPSPEPLDEGLMSAMEEELTCNVCLEIFNEPRSLPCLHSFCASCLVELMKQEDDLSIKCPLCRKVVYVERGDIATLPLNTYLRNIALKLFPESQSEQFVAYPASAAVTGHPAPSAPPLEQSAGAAPPRPVQHQHQQRPAPAPPVPQQESPHVAPSFWSRVKSIFTPEEQPSAASPAHPGGGPRHLVSRCTLSESQAAEKIKAHLNSLWFTPSGFSSEVQLGQLTLCYLPFYRFRTEAESRYRGRVRYNAAQNPRNQQMEWFTARGTVENTYSRTTLANDRRGLRDLIEGLSFSMRKVHNTSGPVVRLCEAPELSPGDAFALIRNSLIEEERASAKNHMAMQLLSLKPERVEIVDIDTRFKRVDNSQVWYPLYIQPYVYKDKNYCVLVHGTTGETNGQRPYGLGIVGTAARAIGSFLGFGAKK